MCSLERGPAEMSDGGLAEDAGFSSPSSEALCLVEGKEIRIDFGGHVCVQLALEFGLEQLQGKSPAMVKRKSCYEPKLKRCEQ